MAAREISNLSYDMLVAMIPFVMDFLDLDSERVIASGILDDCRLDDAAIAMILNHEKAHSEEVGNSSSSDLCPELLELQTSDNRSPLDEFVSMSLNAKETKPVQEPLHCHHATSPSNATETDSFRIHFRMNEATFKTLMEDLMQFTSFTEKKTACKGSVSPADMLMFTLRFLGCRDSMSQLAAVANVTETTYSCVVHETMEALYQLLPNYICWPDDSQVMQISDKFRQRSGLQGVLGTIDVLHVPIKAPAEHVDYYTNQQNETTIVLQSVCDDKLRFIHCCTGWPGSMEEETVLRDSDLHIDIRGQVSTYFPFDSYLVGDEAYCPSSWLVTPFTDSGNLSVLQQQFNAACKHILQDNTVLYSHLLQRFPRLENVEMKDTQSMVVMILVCCALHNLCVDNGDHGLWKGVQVTIRNINTSKSYSLNEKDENKRQQVLQTLQS